MPRTEIGGELVEVIDCPACGRTVMTENRTGFGYLANCGRRLTNLSEASGQCMPASNVNKCPSCQRLFKDGETCSRGGCPMGGDF